MSRRARTTAAVALTLCTVGSLLPSVASATATSRGLQVTGSGGTQTTVVLKQTTTLTDIQWLNSQPSSADAGVAIRAGSKTPVMEYWLPSLRHGPESVLDVQLPVKLAPGRYTVSLLGRGRLTMRLVWTGPNLKLVTHGKAPLTVTAKTDYGTAPFDRRWLVNVPAHALVMAGYIVYGSADVSNVRYCFHAGQNSCLTPLAGYSGVADSGGTMYYLVYPPGQLTPGTYEFGEIAASDSPSLQAGGFVVTLSP